MASSPNAAASAAATSSTTTTLPPSTSDSTPMHAALISLDLQSRDSTMKVLLESHPEYLQQRDRDGRLPLHLACLQSATATVGSISLDTIKTMLRLSEGEPLVAVDKENKTPMFYAMQQMSLHAFNEASSGIKISRETPSKAAAYSRALLSFFMMLFPNSITHKCCINYTLHWFIFQGFPLKILKKFVAAYDAFNELAESAGTRALPNPYLAKDAAGRLPLHIACQAQGSVGLDIIEWLCEATPQSGKEALHTRDTSILQALKREITDPQQLMAMKTIVPGHYPLFYACTTQIDDNPSTSPKASSSSSSHPTHAPLYKIPASQVSIIEYLLKAWPETILEIEGAPLLHESEIPLSLVVHKDAPVKSDVKFSAVANASITNTFLEWIYQLKALELLTMFLRFYPSCIDNLAWKDEHDHGSIGIPGAAPNMLSMLHCSACIGDIELVELLLKAGANPFNHDTRGKIPIDYCVSEPCIALLRLYMSRDPRRPKTPEPVIVMVDSETQTVSGDSVLESARAKIKNREAELLAEQAKLQADAVTTQKELELERLRLKEQEDTLLRQLDEDRQKLAEEKIAQQKQTDDLISAKTHELQSLQTKIQANAEHEQHEREQRELQRRQELEAKLAAEKMQFERDVTAQTEAIFKEEAHKMQSLLQQERTALQQKEIELKQQFEADRTSMKQQTEAERDAMKQQLEEDRLAMKKSLEHSLGQDADQRLQAEAKRLTDEVEVVKRKLKDREDELIRQAELEKSKLESDYAHKTQTFNLTSQQEMEKLDLEHKMVERERKALAEREIELRKELEHERNLSRKKYELECKQQMEAQLLEQQTAQRDQHQTELQRLKAKEESMAQELQSKQDAMARELAEAKLAARAHAEQEARLAAEHEFTLKLAEEKRQLHEKATQDALAAQAKLHEKEQELLQRHESEAASERRRLQDEFDTDRKRFESQVQQRLAQLDEEKASLERLASESEQAVARQRELTLAEQQKTFQASLDALADEREKLTAAFGERTRKQEEAAEQEEAAQRQLAEEQKLRWETSLQEEKQRLADEYHARLTKLEQDEQQRLAHLQAEDDRRRQQLVEEDAHRRSQHEAERLRRQEQDAQEHRELMARLQNEREHLTALEQELRTRHEREEGERTKKYEHELHLMKMQLEAEHAHKIQALTLSTQKQTEQLEHERKTLEHTRKALEEREIELRKELEHEQKISRMKYELECKQQMEAKLLEQQNTLQVTLHTALQRLKTREETIAREFAEHKAAVRTVAEQEAKEAAEADFALKLAEEQRKLQLKLVDDQRKLQEELGKLAEREQELIKKHTFDRAAERAKLQEEFDLERKRFEAQLQQRLDELDERLAAANAATPRGALNPLKGVKSPAGHTTHIHVYPSNGHEGPKDIGLSSSTFPGLKSPLPSSPASSGTRPKHSREYHWEFLPRPKNSLAVLNASAPKLTNSSIKSPKTPLSRNHAHSYSASSLLTSPAFEQQQHAALTAEDLVNSPTHPINVEHTIYSLQSTTNDLDRLLTQIHSPNHSRQNGSPSRR